MVSTEQSRGPLRGQRTDRVEDSTRVPGKVDHTEVVPIDSTSSREGLQNILQFSHIQADGLHHPEGQFRFLAIWVSPDSGAAAPRLHSPVESIFLHGK